MRAIGLGKKFAGRWVFRGIDIELAKGQCLCVLGRNGSGKSTLLRVLAGLQPPSEGRVERGDKNSVGYAALDLALYPHLTASEHLDLFARLRGVAVDPPTTLEAVGLGDVAGKPVGAFSTGMRARLKLALATLSSPQVLLLDEPSAALDEAGQNLVATLIADQLTRGAVIVATNDLADRRFATHELELVG